MTNHTGLLRDLRKKEGIAPMLDQVQSRRTEGGSGGRRSVGACLASGLGLPLEIGGANYGVRSEARGAPRYRGRPRTLAPRSPHQTAAARGGRSPVLVAVAAVKAFALLGRIR
jgi:hypothetical protein